MIFSKSFGYALRSILYIALLQDEDRKIQADEIAEKLAMPRHFEGKILKRLVKEDLLISAKGPHGGFSLHPQTLSTSIFKVVEITDGLTSFNNCVLRLRECNSEKPCPLHSKMVEIKLAMKEVLEKTLIADLLEEDKEEFIKSICTLDVEELLQKKVESAQ